MYIGITVCSAVSECYIATDTADYICLSALVSKPAVSQVCLSPEQKTVSFSSEGDEVEFILLLDDNLLIKTQPKIAENHSISNVTISLHGELMGKLMCIVQNNISREQTIIHLIRCAGNIKNVLLKYSFILYF